MIYKVDKNKKLKKISMFFLFLNLSFTVFLSIYTLIMWNSVNENWYSHIATLAILQLIINSLLLFSLKLKIFDFRMWFVILTQIFSYGRIYILFFNKSEYLFWDIMINYTLVERWQGGLLALVINQAFYTGMLLFIHRPKETTKNKSFLFNKKYSNYLFIAGIIIFGVLIPFKLYVDINNIIYIIETGRYGAAETDGVIGNLSLLYPIGLFMIISSKKLSSRKSFFIILLFSFLTLLLSVYTGDRRNAVTSIIALSLCFIYVYKIKIDFRRILLFSTMTLMLLVFLTIIREIRSVNSGTISLLFSYLKNFNFSFKNILWETLSEFGLSFFTYTNAVKFYPSEINFNLGLSYFLIPLLAIPGIGLIFEQITDLTSIAKIAVDTFEYSVGGTVGMELYGNFGLFGIFFAFLLGYLISKYYISMLYNSKKSQTHIVYYFVLLYFFLSLPRASFVELSRQVIWTLIILKTVFWVIDSKMKHVKYENMGIDDEKQKNIFHFTN